MPTEVLGLAKPAANEGAEKRPGIDAHIEDAKTGVTTRIALRVQFTNNSADIRFEQPRPGDD